MTYANGTYVIHRKTLKRSKMRYFGFSWNSWVPIITIAAISELHAFARYRNTYGDNLNDTLTITELK